MIEQPHRDPRDDGTDDQDAEATPPPLHDQHDRDDEHDARGDHLRDADDDLFDARRQPRHRFDEVGLRPADRAVGDRGEDYAERDERRRR